MKNSTLLLSFLACTLCTMTFADIQPDPAIQASAPIQAKNRPCLNIAVACENAGYRLGKTIPGKNIWRDCVRPLVNGQSIPNIAISTGDIQACQAKMAERKQKRMQKMQQMQSNPSGQ